MDAAAVIDGADSALHELKSRCTPGGEFDRLDRILAGRIALLSGRILSDLAKLLALVRPEEPPCESEGHMLFRERWVSATGESLGLTREARLMRRGLTGPWECLKEGADRLDLHQVLEDEKAKKWRKVDLSLDAVESHIFRKFDPADQARRGRRGDE